MTALNALGRGQEVDASQDAALLIKLNAAVDGDTAEADAAAAAMDEGADDAADMAEDTVEDLVDAESLELLRALPADERLAFAQNLGLAQHLCGPFCLAALAGRACCR